MANEDSQNRQDFNKNFLSTVFKPLKSVLDKNERSHSPAPSEGSRGRSSFVGRIFGSNRNQGRARSLGSSGLADRDDRRGSSVLPEPQELVTTPPETRNDRRGPPVASRSQGPKNSPDVPNPTNVSPSQGSKPDASTGESPELTARMSVKDDLKLTGRFLQTLAKRAVDIVDSNPVHVALGLVKAIIEVYNAVKDNKDEVAHQIALTGGHLEEVEKALDNWKPGNKDSFTWIDRFKAFVSTLEDELQGLGKMRDESNFRKFLDHEDEQGRIKAIFSRIDEARIRFELALGIRIFKAMYEVDQAVRALFFDRLKPSEIAHHDYILEGEEERLVRRQVCIPGTRARILDGIVTWAKDTSLDSPNVYWLFGHAGSGKTTIAYTIARRFEFAGDLSDSIVLGGNFFCSRQFGETRSSKYIIRTIVYHLALKCRPFADALRRSGKLDTISQSHSTQLDSLLFGPWFDSESARLANTSEPKQYLIVIDALDEIDGSGGSDFLKSLVNAINKIDAKRLSGLKFLITSRLDPELVTHVESLEQKQLYRLQDVNEAEVRGDIATYLEASLSHFKGRRELEQLAEEAAGLFIYAATVVKHLAKLAPVSQRNALDKLLTNRSTESTSSQSSLQALDRLLGQLYHQILDDAFGPESLDHDQLPDYLAYLFSFLCAKEPLSVPTATGLLFQEDPEEIDDRFSYSKIGDDVIKRLHSVLYIEHGKVLSYHKSFSDFMFDRMRSGNYWCDKAIHHRYLTTCCFREMEGRKKSPEQLEEGLRFNIAHIPSSFVFDRDNHALVGEVERNISSGLSYACQSWDHHLSFVETTSSDPLFEMLSEFLRLRALFWIEAMNLLNSRQYCTAMLRRARERVIDSKGDPKLAKDLADAASFALYFSGSGTSSSTPHLYISTLASWAGKDDICEEWKRNFPRIPQFINAAMGGILLMTINTDNEVRAVACSRDGHHIISGMDDGSIRVRVREERTREAGERLVRLRGRPAYVAKQLGGIPHLAVSSL